MASVSWSLETHFSNWSITSVPFSSKNADTDLVNSVSLEVFNFPSVKETLRVYWSSNLRKHNRRKYNQSHSIKTKWKARADIKSKKEWKILVFIEIIHTLSVCWVDCELPFEGWGQLPDVVWIHPSWILLQGHQEDVFLFVGGVESQDAHHDKVRDGGRVREQSQSSENLDSF